MFMYAYVHKFRCLWKPETSDPWNQSYRQLRYPMWMLRIKFGSSSKAFNHWAHFPASPPQLIFCFPLFSFCLFESGSVTDIGASWTSYTGWPVSSRDPALHYRPVQFGTRSCRAVPRVFCWYLSKGHRKCRREGNISPGPLTVAEPSMAFMGGEGEGLGGVRKKGHLKWMLSLTTIAAWWWLCSTGGPGPRPGT